MARIDNLLESYRRHVAIPVRQNMPLSQRVWFVVYPPEDERRMASRYPEFEMATREAGLGWLSIDLAGVFADWMDTFPVEERDECLANPEIVEAYAEPQFKEFVCRRLMMSMAEIEVDAQGTTVFAVTGLMDLFDFVHVSSVVEGLDDQFRGIVVVFFPGDREGNTYRFMGARSGWNYLAVPILAEG
jgi:hypothetical protein